MDPSQLLQVVGLALLQGVTELFPVSSLGHTIIIPGLFGDAKLVKSETFLPIVVVLHLGTAVALLTFFWRDWLALIRAFFKTLFARRLDADPQGKTIWLVIAATIPAGLLGFIFEKKITELFFSARWPVLPAAFLTLNGAVLFVSERMRRRAEPEQADRVKQERAFKRLEEMSFPQAFFIGTMQATALLPGISRSGITIVAGMQAKLSHEESARFAFLLATPIIAAAALKEVPKLVHAGTSTLEMALIGGVVAGAAAFVSVKFLMRYFQVGRLTPFAIYCLLAGLGAFLFFSWQTLAH
ncbi:MAG: undecaprenyl-diphosphate phosphatase [Ktedonobacterales bacterium]|nr:undecaprenyl-diphosphate phosphatase [Ktedonobacterales bacterium]